MREDTWTNTKTKNEYGVTGPLGSPRAWLRRALDESTLIDTTFQPGSLTQSEISVAGIWYKKPDGYGIPVTGMYRELFRWFDIPVPEHMARGRNSTLVPAIGLCAAVPYHEVVKWLKTYESAGASYVWWKRPQDTAVRAVGEGLKIRRQLDHHAVYRLLDSGMSTSEIAIKLDFPEPNIYYVAKKWRAGVELRDRKPHLNIPEIMEACRAGVKVSDLAEQYQTSTSYIYLKLKEFK